MNQLSPSFEIRVSLFSASPTMLLKALDVPGVAVCDVIRDAASLPGRVFAVCPHVLVLGDAAEDTLLLEIGRLQPVCPPRIVRCAAETDPADAVQRAMLTPCSELAEKSMPQRGEIARQLLNEIGMSPNLLGYDCITQGAALLSATPAPLPPLQYHLYPLLAETLGISTAAVEKRIRSAIESAWLLGDLAAQSRLLGLSVSAERGKPTNSELLFRLADKIGGMLYTR